jgi:hypothetical protein
MIKGQFRKRGQEKGLSKKTARQKLRAVRKAT